MAAVSGVHPNSAEPETRLRQPSELRLLDVAGSIEDAILAGKCAPVNAWSKFRFAPTRR